MTWGLSEAVSVKYAADEKSRPLMLQGIRPPRRLFRGIRDKPQTNRVFLLWYIRLLRLPHFVRKYEECLHCLEA